MPARIDSSAPSIRQRLLRRTLGLVMLAASGAAIVAAYVVSTAVREVMESSLEETAQALMVLAEHDAEVHTLSRGRAMPAPPHKEAIRWQLRTPSGRLVARSHDAPETTWAEVPLVEGHSLTAESAVYTIAGKGLWLQVAQPLHDFLRAQRVAGLTAGAVFMLLGCVIALMLALSIRQETRPIEELARAVDGLALESLTLDPPSSPRRELAPVYVALDELLLQLRAKLRSERAFAAHAAHSLRTPLAGLLAQLELISATAPAELAARLGPATDAARQLGGVVQALLVMARASGRVRWREFAASDLATGAAGRRIAIDTSPLASAGVLKGDPDLIAVAVLNLVDNAERHGALAAVIRSGTQDGQHFIEIEDDGPGIATDRLSRVQRALQRYEESGQVDEHLGLGLTLASSVARAHGGTLRLGCGGARHAGLCVRLLWPCASPVPGPQGPPRPSSSARGA